MSGLLLAIDTANERCSAALLRLRDGQMVASVEEPIGRGHAERLMATIEAVLTEGAADWSGLEKLAVCVGPGSFTGIRVGVAAVQGLQIALGLPAVGVSTLEALAEPEWAADPVLAVHDAKRGEVYAALYAMGGEEIEAPAAMEPPALVGFCKRIDGPLQIVGTGAEIAAAALAGRSFAKVDATGAASIASIARLGAARQPDAVPLPLYLRGADARAQTPAGLRAASV